MDNQKLRGIAYQIKNRDQAFVDRFWGNLKTYGSCTLPTLEKKLNFINRKLDKKKAELNLLEAEQLAVTAVITKKLEKVNADAKTTKTEGWET